MSFTHIEQSDLVGKGVIGLPDTPNLNTTEIQEKFDEIALDVIVPKFNELADELDAADIDSSVQSEDVTNIRLNSDRAIEVSSDGGATWGSTSSSGHRIQDGSGTIYEQRSRLQFSNNVNIQDDEDHNATVLFIQPGEKGDPGKAGTITIGSVQSGVEPEVTNSGSATDAILNFTFPKGDEGSAATIQVGTVTSGASANVTNRGTSNQAIFDFSLPKGDKGDPGQGIIILGEYATLADLQTAHPTGSAGSAYMVGALNPKDLYIWDVDSAQWTNLGPLQGVQGDPGDAATITVGTVTSGATMSVTNVGTTSEAILDFVLQKGDTGSQGPSGTIAVGSVSSGATASVTNVGTPSAAVFDFVFPKGDPGPQGNPTTVNGKTGSTVTIYGTDIALSDIDGTKVTTAIGDIGSDITTINTAIGNINTELAKVKWSSVESQLIGDTSCTITDAAIATTSVVEPFSDNVSGTPMSYTSITVTTGQVVLAFDALTEDTDFKVRITN